MHAAMIYEWHDLISNSVKLSFNAAASALRASGILMKSFNASARLPGYEELAHTLLSTAAIYDDLSRNQPVPKFDLTHTFINGRPVAVTEEVLADKAFGQLLHLKCETDHPRNVPKVMIVAPISGHKATILRDTVHELLPDSDVYIVQWKDAREVPVGKGTFSLEDYMGYVQDFIHVIGPDTHLIGISQSTVPVLAVTSLLAARKDACQPMSATLMCGPIDPRINETEISRLTRQRDINWFRQNMIARIPANYPGHGREVFPGFLQAMGMIVAAPGQRQHTLTDIVSKLYRGQGEKIDADAAYYLDTIEQVFLEHRLPRGAMTWRNEKIDPAQIRTTALFTIEGTNDNITAPGQTVIAHELCSQIPADMKHHKTQSGAGHYDLISGPHWKHEISNEIKSFWRKIAARRGIAYDPAQADTPVKAPGKPILKPDMIA